MRNFNTKIIAHRGFSSQYPENTLIAFQKAIEIGADFIELDVHRTKDGVLVVIHDETLERTTSKDTKAKISDLNFSEIRDLSAGYAARFGDEFKTEKIPTLRNVLELAKGKIKVCIEIKIFDAEKEISEIIDDLKMQSEVIIFSFYASVLKKTRTLDAEIALLYLVDQATENSFKTAVECGCKMIGVGAETTVTKAYLARAAALNLEAWQFTIDDETEMQQLLNTGLQGLITNRPDIALRLAAQ